MEIIGQQGLDFVDFGVGKLSENRVHGLNPLSFADVRDASGNVLSMYEDRLSNYVGGLPSRESQFQTELNLYGSSRLGMISVDREVQQKECIDGRCGPAFGFSLPAVDSVQAFYTAGMRSYELTDHLGNVRAVVSDNKLTALSVSPQGQLTVARSAEVLSLSDYYSFGWGLTGRSYSSGGYRYGYQGSEKDDEVSGSGNSYTTFFRQLDPRLGRWLSVDPKATAPESPYVSMGNTPIWANDVLGDEINYFLSGLAGKKFKKIRSFAFKTWVKSSIWIMKITGGEEIRKQLNFIQHKDSPVVTITNGAKLRTTQENVEGTTPQVRGRLYNVRTTGFNGTRMLVHLLGRPRYYRRMVVPGADGGWIRIKRTRRILMNELASVYSKETGQYDKRSKSSELELDRFDEPTLNTKANCEEHITVSCEEVYSNEIDNLTASNSQQRKTGAHGGIMFSSVGEARKFTRLMKLHVSGNYSKFLRYQNRLRKKAKNRFVLDRFQKKRRD